LGSTPLMQTETRRRSLTSLPVLLTGIVLVAALLRLWNIGGPSLWGDELYSISFSRVPMDQLWGDWMVRETNPPLFYSILKGWIALFGEQDVALRVLTITVGLLALGGIFLFVRALHSNQAALLAVALAAVSSLQVAYSTEIRGYIFGALFASLTLLALVKLVDVWKSDDASLRRQFPWLALYAASAAAAFHTHTTFVVLPILANAAMSTIYLWRTSRARFVALGWIGANAVLLLLCLWWGLMTLQRLRDGADPISWIPEPTIKDVVAIMSHIVATRSFELANILFGMVFGALALWGAWHLTLERRIIVGAIGIGAPVLLVLVSLVQPVFLERTVFWLQFIYLGCIAIGLLSLPWKRWRVPAMVAAITVLAADMLTWELTAYREPWRDVARVLREQSTPRDAVLLYTADAGVNLDHYCRLHGCGSAKWIALDEPTFNTVLPEYFRGELVPRERMGGYVEQFERIWVVRRRREDPTSALDGHASLATSNLLGLADDDRVTLSIWKPKGPPAR
jgi:mannosyltransferase